VRFGNAHIRPVAGDGSAAALAYVCGEACKYGAPDVWIPRRIHNWREVAAHSGARSSVAPEATPGEAPEWAPEWWQDL
jgi:hypothetical protein